MDASGLTLKELSDYVKDSAKIEAWEIRTINSLDSIDKTFKNIEAAEVKYASDPNILYPPFQVGLFFPSICSLCRQPHDFTLPSRNSEPKTIFCPIRIDKKLVFYLFNNLIVVQEKF